MRPSWQTSSYRYEMYFANLHLYSESAGSTHSTIVLFPLCSRWWWRWSEKPLNVNGTCCGTAETATRGFIAENNLGSDYVIALSLLLMRLNSDAEASCLTYSSSVMQQQQLPHILATYNGKYLDIATHNSPYFLTAFKGSLLLNCPFLKHKAQASNYLFFWFFREHWTNCSAKNCTA